MCPRCATLRCRHSPMPDDTPMQTGQRATSAQPSGASGQPGRQANVGAAVQWQGLQHSLANGASGDGTARQRTPARRVAHRNALLLARFLRLLVCLFVCLFAANLLERAGFIDEPRSLARPAIGKGTRRRRRRRRRRGGEEDLLGGVRHLTATARGDVGHSLWR